MGLLIGAAFGVGLLLIWQAGERPQRRGPRRRASTSWKFQLAVASCLVGATALMFAVSHVPVVALAFGILAAMVPVSVRRAGQVRRRREFADAWPDAVDHLASAVRAGLSIGEALTQLGDRGPAALRAPFRAFGSDLARGVRFHDALDALKAELADPVGDRVLESLRLARDVGGGDLGRVLRSLGTFLRDDQRTRGELESRQSWVVNGARLAVAAPWLVLAAMSVQRDVIARFSSPTGLVIIAGGGLVCLVSYRAMLRLGRLPVEERVLA